KQHCKQKYNRSTRRRYQDDGISDDEIEGKRTFNLDEKLVSARFGSDLVTHMEGKDFTFEYIQRGGLRDPIIFDKAEGLGLHRRIVDVMDVKTQRGIEMSMAQWGRYYETPPSEREKLYNVISLEFSHTRLENLVKRPASVDLIDWVDNMWPRHLKERQRDSTNAIVDMHYPKVQKYCLMSVQGCFTDFHIDFGGTSVWYHVLWGGKVFWLIPPTPQNLEMYENWVLSGKQGDIFLGDKCHDCQRIELKKGNTFIIPSGWIHAVYTPEDTLVFGGNFLHSFNIPMQLNIYTIEDRTRVPLKFRYPFYYEMCWYLIQEWSLSPDPEIKDVEVKEDDVVKEEEPGQVLLSRHVLTPFELEGLWNLLGKLEELPANKKCVPEGIGDAATLLLDMKAALSERVKDDLKLSYTGEPIVSWPKRPSWYRPPSPPSPALYRPRLAPTLPKTLSQMPSKRSISALRRKRVRCKRCAGCRRKECGTCHACQDMRKFGGTGRMKKGCMLRQCLLPALPNTARCAICLVGESHGSNKRRLALMECVICSEIAHRQCIKEPGQGKMNKELPSCWECPKCYQAKSSDSEESGDSEPSSTTQPSSKLSYPPGMSNGSQQRRHARPPGRSTAPPPSQNLLLQHQQSRKRASELELRLKKKVGLNVLFGYHSFNLGCPDHSSCMRPGLIFTQFQQSSGPLHEPKGEPHRVRGRGVRLRGGGAGRGITGGKSHKDLKEEESDDSSSSSSSRGGDKENQPQLRKGPMAQLKEEKMDVHSNAVEEDPDDTTEHDAPPVDRVTLQRPTRAPQDQSAIVPKLEAVAPQMATNHQRAKVLPRPPIRNLSGIPDQRSHKFTPPHTRSGSSYSHPPHPEKLSLSRAAKLTNGASSSSAPELPHQRVPLSALQEGGADADRDGAGGGLGCDREVWVSVFRYLSRADLCVCMAVCKNWYKWCLDKRLWAQIDLSVKRTVTPQALTGIIKRQPVTLDLSWTNISKKQLTWLIGRLPGLRDLMVAGCSWSSISALCSSGCPLLRSLDLRYADGIKDAQIRDLVIPPGCDNRSQLRALRCLRVAGLDISDATLRLVIRHMPHLTKLDLSHCNSLNDHSVNLLTAVGSSTRNTLSELNLGGCSKLTDACLKYLRRLSCISVLDLRGCKGVSRKACEAFITELSVNALYCLSDETLIQRIS
uniref:[histone H3]-dimethyl-L-lysine(36) demethylase n=1 Tax=Gouania willdenowi TaxID=441366 RepID=A0A8C5HH16_GOUWI